LTSGFRYSNAGIIPQDLVLSPIPQRALFDNLDHEKAAKVMAAMDEANRRWGRATVVPAALGIASSRRSRLSSRCARRSSRRGGNCRKPDDGPELTAPGRPFLERHPDSFADCYLNR
jgi:hypothetical protein